MPYLIASVVLTGALGLLNLVLGLAVIRRLREHTALLAAGSSRRGPVMKSAGTTVDDYTVADVDGEPVSRTGITGPTLVAALSPGCGPCRDQLPILVRAAREMPGGRDRVLAIIVDTSGGGAGTMVEALRPVARVVLDPPDGPMVTAYGVEGYPAFGLVDRGGVVLTSGFRPDRVPLPAPA